jgi:hypothetical protein
MVSISDICVIGVGGMSASSRRRAVADNGLALENCQLVLLKGRREHTDC